MTRYGITIIRIGLAGVLLWFGAQQLMDTTSWTGYVPEMVVSMSGIPAKTLVLANGATEVAFGLMLLLGLFTRVAAFVMALHLAGIAFSLGVNAVAVRDWGLFAALLGLVFTGAGAWGLDRENS
jgi:uncharacterized membrane protein YphA (DoxX/SURF4 family)